jgi:hypothetical protein
VTSSVMQSPSHGILARALTLRLLHGVSKSEIIGPLPQELAVPARMFKSQLRLIPFHY